jgi:hypothetical protein
MNRGESLSRPYLFKIKVNELELMKTELTGKCPNCNCTYIVIDEELVFCPGCALSIIEDISIIYEEEEYGK